MNHDHTMAKAFRGVDDDLLKQDCQRLCINGLTRCQGFTLIPLHAFRTNTAFLFCLYRDAYDMSLLALIATL